MKKCLFFLWLLTVAAWGGSDMGECSERPSAYNGYPAEQAPAGFYFYDYLNRPYPFTPDPIWRQMFRGMQERIEAERRVFGVPGQSAVELEYYIRAYQQRRSLWQQQRQRPMPGK